MPAEAAPIQPADFGHAGFQGLTEDAAQQRLLQDGPNELPSRESRGILAIAWEVIREPMFLLLVGAGSLYLLMGE
nr:hypothetical protein [Geothrix sp.]